MLANLHYNHSICMSGEHHIQGNPLKYSKTFFSTSYPISLEYQDSGNVCTPSSLPLLYHCTKCVYKFLSEAIRWVSIMSPTCKLRQIDSVCGEKCPQKQTLN